MMTGSLEDGTSEKMIIGTHLSSKVVQETILFTEGRMSKEVQRFSETVVKIGSTLAGTRVKKIRVTLQSSVILNTTQRILMTNSGAMLIQL